MYESADEGDHPAPSSLRIIVSAQQLLRLHLRVVFRLNSRDVALVHAVVDLRRMSLLLRGRVVVGDRTASFACRIQQRPGSRAGYRHHRREDDSFRGYVPVSLPIVRFVHTVFVYVFVARIGTARDRARFVRSMLPIVPTYVLPIRFFLTTTARQRLPTGRRTKRTSYTLDTVSRTLESRLLLSLLSSISLIAIVSGSQLLKSIMLDNESLTANIFILVGCSIWRFFTRSDIGKEIDCPNIHSILYRYFNFIRLIIIINYFNPVSMLFKLF